MILRVFQNLTHFHKFFKICQVLRLGRVFFSVYVSCVFVLMYFCFCIFCVFVLCFYLPSFWCRGNTRMSCCFVASRHSDKNLSNRLDYLSRLPFASLFIDNSWLITETVSNLQENQSSSWRRPRGCCHHAHLCSNAAHAYMLKCSNAQMLMLYSKLIIFVCFFVIIIIK